MSERFMEQARDHQQHLEDKALAEVRARANKLFPPDWDGKTCYTCGDDIPKKRLDLAISADCIHCAARKEKRL